MPEGVEIELYRRTADQAVGRRIASVDTPDEWYLKEGTSPDEVAAACVGAEVIATRRSASCCSSTCRVAMCSGCVSG
ncbi:MAG: DNA-formamidopyrimidine glycosylase family protein [Acidimicrobiales bacterium]